MHRKGFAFTALVAVLATQTAFAQNIRPKASNYQMPTDVQAVGGGEGAKSTYYILDDTIGEANIGPSRSGTYDLNAGYRQTVADAYVALGCDDTANLGTLSFSGQAESSITCTVTTDADAGYALSWRAGSNNHSGLHGYWKFDETTGSTAYDLSGFGNNGTYQGNTTQSTAIPSTYFSTRSLSLDGTADYVTLANESHFDFERTDPFSISTWFKTDTTATSSQTLFSKMAGTPYTGISFDLFDGSSNSDALTLYIVNNVTTNAITVRSTNTNLFSTDTWYHVTATYDGSSTAGGVKMYVNGILIPTTITTNSLSASIQNDISPRIGARGDGSSSWAFDGLIDEMRIYDRVLSYVEIQDLASKSPPGSMTQSGSQVTHIPAYNMPSTGGVVGWWKMDQIPSGGSVADSSGRSNNGTLGGATGTNNTPQPSTDIPAGANHTTVRSLDFDGTDDNISLTLNGMGSTNTATMTAWVKADSIDTFDSILETRSTGLQGLLLSGATGNPLTFAWEGGSDEYSAATGLFLDTGKWYFVAVTIAPTSATVYRISATGAVATYTLDKTYNAKSLSASSWRIGQDPSQGGRFWDGRIDDVRIYNRTLSAGEIRAMAGVPHTWSVGNTAASWGGRLSSASTDTDAKWGTDGGTEYWMPVGEGSYPLATRSSRTSVSGSTQIIDFRAEIGALKVQPPGLYSSVVVFTASAL